VGCSCDGTTIHAASRERRCAPGAPLLRCASGTGAAALLSPSAPFACADASHGRIRIRRPAADPRSTRCRRMPCVIVAAARRHDDAGECAIVDACRHSSMVSCGCDDATGQSIGCGSHY
jgi:hypothetical protein